MFGKGNNEQTSQKKLKGWQAVIGGIILVLLLRNCVDSSSKPSSTIVSSESSPPSSLLPSSTETLPSSVEVTQIENSFGFPKTTCGDKPTGTNNPWYPVFIDGADLENIRTKYCADAIATQRKNTGIDTVQLASFTSRERAMVLAQAVGGEVGEPTTPGKFPLSNCGDKPSGSSDTWFPVFIDDGDLVNIRGNYCADAVATKRQDTGVATVQLASFTSYDKALAFAKEVGGEVGQPTYPAQTAQGSLSQEDSGVENTGSDTTANSSVSESYSTPSSIAPSGLISTSSSGSGGCSSPDDTDSIGRRCGARAASVRPGGESGSIGSDYSGSSYTSGGYTGGSYTGSRSTYVRSYTRRDGTFVRGHYRSRGRR